MNYILDHLIGAQRKLRFQPQNPFQIILSTVIQILLLRVVHGTVEIIQLSAQQSDHAASCRYKYNLCFIVKKLINPLFNKKQVAMDYRFILRNLFQLPDKIF